MTDKLTELRTALDSLDDEIIALAPHLSDVNIAIETILVMKIFLNAITES